MKEFSAQTGGRYTYVDDIVNLQDLSLAFASIFSDCDNFIISGCQVSGTSISEGYVYINGKIRRFSGVSSITTWPQYLYESNRTETVAYASGADKVGRNIYGCAIAKSIPTSIDPLTGKAPGFIEITAKGGMNINDALFGKYALLLKSATGKQTVSDAVTFTQDVAVGGALSMGNRVTLTQGSAVAQMSYSGENLVVQSQVASGVTYRIVISNGEGFQFYVNNTLVYTITNSQIRTPLPMFAPSFIAGNMVMEDNDIYNGLHASNTARVNINMVGYNGGTDYSRDVYIGDGRGSAIMIVNGADGRVQINGDLSVKSNAIAGLTLKCNMSAAALGLRKTISWVDTTTSEIAYIGYNRIDNNVFEIKNSVAGVQIIGADFVDLGPVIKEGGVLLSDKYVTLANLTIALDSKADTTAVYTTEQADGKFAAKNGGFSQFTNAYTKLQLRNQIEAVSAAEVASVHPTKSNLLADMAVNEEKKEQIRKNIGAAKEGSYQKTLYDSGWVHITGHIYGRQIGNTVCIQGTLKAMHSALIYIRYYLDRNHAHNGNLHQ